MYSWKERRILNKISRDWFACRFSELDDEEQENVYAFVVGHGFLD